MTHRSKFLERSAPPTTPVMWRMTCIALRPNQRAVVLPMFTARHRHEIVRCGCTTAITGIKPYRKQNVNFHLVHGSKRRWHCIVIPGAVHEINGRESEIIGEKIKNLRKVTV